MSEAAVGTPEISDKQGGFCRYGKDKEEMDILVETIEIMNDKKLMEGIERSKKDAKAGRVTKIKSAAEVQFEEIRSVGLPAFAEGLKKK